MLSFMIRTQMATISNPPRNFSVIVLSDIHISRYSGLFNLESFIYGWEKICSLISKDPDGDKVPIIVLGDITDTGTYDDFTYAKSLLDKTIKVNKIKNPIYYLPGNHDEKNVGFENYDRFFGSRSFKIVDDDKKYVILGIDSSIPDEDTGNIGSVGREEIEKLVAIPESYTKIVCFHHHLIPIPKTGRERGTILDGGDILESLFYAGVDVLITAHKHNCHSRIISNGARNIVIINAGTFSCNKTRGMMGHTFVKLSVANDEDIFVYPIAFESYSPHYSADDAYIHYRKFNHRYKPQFYIAGAQPYLNIIQLSDTHFTEGSEFLRDIYDRGVSLINASNAELVVHCGDVTNESYPQEYNLAKEKLRAIQKPLLIIPGHRDLQPLGITRFVQLFGPLDPFFVTEKFCFQGINSSKAYSSEGHIGRSRLAMLEQTLEQEKWATRFFIVGMHHALIPIPRSIFKTPIEDAGEVLDFLEKHRIPLVLSGHEHQGAALQIQDSVFVNAGTFSSKKVKSDRGNTFNAITVFNNGVVSVEEVQITTGERFPLGTFFTKFRVF